MITNFNYDNGLSNEKIFFTPLIFRLNFRGKSWILDLLTSNLYNFVMYALFRQYFVVLFSTTQRCCIQNIFFENL